MKRMLTILGILFFSFGFIEFMMLFVSACQDQTGRYIDQKPLYTTNGIAVDSKGYLYYGIREFSTIQVYDNTGVFMYRFSFRTRGAGYFVLLLTMKTLSMLQLQDLTAYIAIKMGT